MSDCYDLILGLRALRDYRPEPLSSEDLDAILEAARWTGSSKNRQNWSFIVVTNRDRLQGLAECGDFTQPVRDSAATIVLVREPEGYEFDLGRVAQNIMLAAKTRGVASCPITLHRDEDARVFLDVPEGKVTRYAVALGYPADTAKPARFGGRKPQEAVIHREKY
ncbi:MAG: nitroreductase family protein [Acidimicrobiia bacterium]